LEVLGGKEVIFAALVNDTQLAVQFGVRVRPDLVDLAPDEIDALVFAGLDAERVSTGFDRGSLGSHSSR
jgi:hypothetical protein